MDPPGQYTKLFLDNCSLPCLFMACRKIVGVGVLHNRSGGNWYSADCRKTIHPEVINQHSLFQGG